MLSMGSSTSPTRTGYKTAVIQPLPRGFVVALMKMSILIQARYWVRSWQSYLGDRATPKDLVHVIVKKEVGNATELKDHIKKQFNIVEPSV